MPLMDVIFGTYYEPKHLPRAYGISENISHGYVQQIIGPLNPFQGPKHRRHRTIMTLQSLALKVRTVKAA